MKTFISFCCRFVCLLVLALNFSNLLAENSIEKKNGYYGVINEQGVEIIPFRYTLLKELRDMPGLYVVHKRNETIGVYNDKGEEIIPTDRYTFCMHVLLDKSYDKILVKSNGKEGIIRKDGKIIIPAEKYSSISYSSCDGTNDVYIVHIGERAGLCNAEGFEIIPPVYDMVSSPFSHFPYAKVHKDNYVGLCDPVSGKVLIPASRYYSIQQLKNGKFMATKPNMEVAILDETFKEVFSKKGRNIQPVIGKENIMRYAVFYGKDNYYFVDEAGNMLDSFTDNDGSVYQSTFNYKPDKEYFNDEEHHYSGYRITNEQGMFGVIDEKGKIIIPCKFDVLTYRKEYQVWEGTKGKYKALYSKTGVNIIPLNYTRIFETLDYHNDSLLLFPKTENGFVAAYTLNGKRLIEANKYTKLKILSRQDSLLLAYVDDKVGVVKFDGQEIISSQFSSLAVKETVIGKCFLIKQGDRYGLANYEGQIIIPSIYESLTIHGLTKFNKWAHVTVRKNGLDGIYDMTGKEIIPAGVYDKVTVSTILSYCYPSIHVYIGESQGIYDLFGNVLVPVGDYKRVSIMKDANSSNGWAINITTPSKYANKDRICSYELYTNKLIYDSEPEYERENYIKCASDNFDLAKYSEAIKCYTKALQIRESDYLYYNRGAAYYNQSQYDKAILDLKKCISISKSNSLIGDANDLIDKANRYKNAESERKQQTMANVGAVIGGLFLGAISTAASALLVKNNMNANYNMNSYSGASSHSSHTDNSYTETSNSTSSHSNSSSKSSSLCLKCCGTGHCSQCNGTGCRTDNAFGTGKDCSHSCGICGGSGACPKCGGSGRL